MIELIRRPDDPVADGLAAALRDLVVAHSVTVVDRPGQARLPDGTGLPAVRHGDRVIGGRAALAGYLAELEQLMADWGRFQGDSCYVDDGGGIC